MIVIFYTNQRVDFFNRQSLTFLFAKNSYVVLSDDPGLGLTFDEAKLNAWAIDKPSARVTMPFARRRGAGLFQVPVGEPEYLPEE